MTRRARMGPIQTMASGLDRMAPGGRRSAAESPIRPFTRPVRQAGATPTPSPLVSCIGYGYNAYLGGTSSGVGAMDWFGPKAAGDVLVAITAVRGSTCIPPPGWTTAFGGTFTGWSGTYAWSVSWGISTSSSASEGVFNGGAPIVGVGQGFIMRATAPHPVLITGPVASSGTTLTYPTVPTTTAVHPVQHVFSIASSDVPTDAIYSPTLPRAFPVWFQTDTHGLRFDGSGPVGAKFSDPTAGGPFPNVPQHINMEHYFSGAPVSCNFVSFVWGWA